MTHTPSELLEMHGKTSPGPWQHDKVRSMGGAPVIVGRRGDRNREREICKVLFDNGSEDPEVRPNAAFIAAAHASVPDICRENARLRTVILWALGSSPEGLPEFPARGGGEPAYWWRKQLRKLAFPATPDAGKETSNG